ncbi:MAG TPA: hypothetical protein DCM02_08545 [Flavobacterium sp.]|nr:hypothetical protein [Flavobacterium sp.]
MQNQIKKNIAFTGSRKGFNNKTLVQTIARSVAQAGHCVLVGCASGVDAAIRSVVPNAKVFSVASPSAGSVCSPAQALARRSMSMVSASSVLIGFASVACPAGVCPSAHFSGGGSGTWASLAYAVSKGLQVFVFCADGVALPSWSGGQWVRAVPSGVWSRAWSFVPSACQLSLI